MPETAEEKGGIFDWFSQVFRSKPLDTPKAEPSDRFLFEDRVALIAELLTLKHNPPAKVEVWAGHVQQLLSQAPPFAELAKTLDSIVTTPVSQPADTGEKTKDTVKSETIVEVIDAAIRLAERHPIATFGRDVQTLISDHVEASLMSSTPARVTRWAIPTLIVILFGGTILGGMKIEGYFNEISKRATLFNEEASRKLGDINAVSDTALAAYRQRLDEEAKSKSGQFTSLIEDKKKTVEGVTDNEIKTLKGFFDGEKGRFTKEGSQTLDTRLKEILQDWDTKQTAVTASYKNLDALIQSTLHGTQIPDKIKEVEDHITSLNTEVGGLKELSQELGELRRSLDTASGGARLTPSQLLSILRWKDFLAVAAVVLSFIMAALLALLYFAKHRYLVGVGVGIIAVAAIVGGWWQL